MSLNRLAKTAAVIAACGLSVIATSGCAPRFSYPSQSADPSASSSPVVVAGDDLFLSLQMAESSVKSFRLHSQMTDVMAFGSLSQTIDGKVSTSGESTDYDITVDIPKDKRTLQVVHVGGVSYVKEAGKWQQIPDKGKNSIGVGSVHEVDPVMGLLSYKVEKMTKGGTDTVHGATCTLWSGTGEFAGETPGTATVTLCVDEKDRMLSQKVVMHYGETCATPASGASPAPSPNVSCATDTSHTVTIESQRWDFDKPVTITKPV